MYPTKPTAGKLGTYFRSAKFCNNNEYTVYVSCYTCEQVKVIVNRPH